MKRGFILALCVAAAPALAQPAGFEDRIGAALAGSGENAGLMRCAGLFRAFRLYAGDDSELGATAAEREGDFAVFAAISWQDETDNDDIDAALAFVVPYIDAGTDLYLERMIENHRATDTVFDDDLEESIAFCNALRVRLLESVE